MGTMTTRSWRVEGMDCAACVSKVTKAVERLPGVSGVTVNLMAERLTATLGPDGASIDAVVRQVTALGYTVSPLPGMAGRTAPDHGADHDRRHDHAGHDHEAADHDHAGDDHARHEHAGHDHAAHDHDHAAHDHAAAGPLQAHDHSDPAEAGLPWWRTGKARLVGVLGLLVLAAQALSMVLPPRLTDPRDHFVYTPPCGTMNTLGVCSSTSAIGPCFISAAG